MSCQYKMLVLLNYKFNANVVSSLKIVFRDKTLENKFQGGFFMSEKILVTQALDQRDLLVNNISIKDERPV